MRFSRAGTTKAEISGHQCGYQCGYQAAKFIEKKNSGAEEGTRTPTPLRVHGPEPCASANSATSALGCTGQQCGAMKGSNIFILPKIFRAHEYRLESSANLGGRIGESEHRDQVMPCLAPPVFRIGKRSSFLMFLMLRSSSRCRLIPIIRRFLSTT